MSIYKFLDPQSAAEKAVSVIGYGYDLTSDIQLSGCKPGPSGSPLIELGGAPTKDLVVPGSGIVVPNVSPAIKCDKGDRIRFHSDVLSFKQMSEQFNQELSLSGKIPSGFFNSMFGYSGCWQKDALPTKNLAFDGWFFTLYNVELAKTQIALSEKVKQEVPSSWDPNALAAFIEKFGTHIVVGVKMGGKDVIYLKQLQSSKLQPGDVQNLLQKLANDEFSEHASVSGRHKSLKEKDQRPITWDLQPTISGSLRPTVVSRSKEKDIWSIHVRQGGIHKGQSHKTWLSTVSEAPNAISMSFVPIVSLLSGVPGSGFLGYAINRYLKYKPPIEELEQFLEFQSPRQWAPTYADLPLAPRLKETSPSWLRFTFLGPRLYVNTVEVDSEYRPVTGVRLYLEGDGNRLAIHLQHLSSVPKSFQLTDDFRYKPNDKSIRKGYLEPVRWKIFSHVCTLPVEYEENHIDDSSPIVTRAWFEVKGRGMKKVLFLRLGYSMVASARIQRAVWDGTTIYSQKSGLLSMLMSTSAPEQKPVKVELNSAVYPNDPPLRAPKMSSFVDTKEIVRGPEDPPGYWLVTGAKLCVEGGKIGVKVKYSLLAV